MKRLLLLPFALLACGGSETSTTDSAATTTIGPAPLTAGDVTGTLSGTTMAEATDSVLGTWTSIVTSGPDGGITGKFVDAAMPTDTVAFTMTLMGDSALSMSAAYTDPALPKEAGQVQWAAVGRATGAAWAGTVRLMRAGTDSILQRSRWKATRTP